MTVPYVRETCTRNFHDIFDSKFLVRLSSATLLINLNPILINTGKIKILCMTIKLKFTEPETEVHITRNSYIGYSYFISFVFVMRA